MPIDNLTDPQQELDNGGKIAQQAFYNDADAPQQPLDQTLPPLQGDEPTIPIVDTTTLLSEPGEQEEEDLAVIDDWLKEATASTDQTPPFDTIKEEEDVIIEREDWEDEETEPIPIEEEDEEEAPFNDPHHEPEAPPPEQDSMGAVFGRMMTQDNLGKMGSIAFEQTDLIKAKLCGYLEEQPYHNFRTSEEMRQIVLSNFKTFFKEANIPIPPSGYILLGSLAMWLAPLGLAGVKRYGQHIAPLIQSLLTQPNTTASTPVQTQKATTSPYPNPDYDAASPYAQLPEYQQGRKFFRVHASTGKYAYHPTNSSIYFPPQEAKETPSPEVMEWKDEGMKDKTIRTLLYA